MSERRNESSAASVDCPACAEENGGWRCTSGEGCIIEEAFGPTDSEKLRQARSAAYTALVIEARQEADEIREFWGRRKDCLNEARIIDALCDAVEALVAPLHAKQTHGRHCPCGACARQDWTKITGPCGMHGKDCPPVYAPLGAGRGSDTSNAPNERSGSSTAARGHDGHGRRSLGCGIERTFRADSA
jgi:hypothetical protein